MPKLFAGRHSAGVGDIEGETHRMDLKLLDRSLLFWHYLHCE